MKTQLTEVTLVEHDGQVVRVESGFTEVSSGWGIRIIGSVEAWLADFRATREARRAEARRMLEVGTPAEVAEARETLTVMKISDQLQPDGWDSDCPIYGGSGWCE